MSDFDLDGYVDREDSLEDDNYADEESYGMHPFDLDAEDDEDLTSEEGLAELMEDPEVDDDDNYDPDTDEVYEDEEW